MLRLTALLAALAVLLAPLPVFAHERWFVEDQAAYPVNFGLIFSLPVLLGVLASATLVGGLALIRRLAGGDNLFPRIWFLRRFDPAAPVVIAIQTAIALIFVAVNGRLLAVNLAPPGALAFVFAAAQLAVAFCFISGLWAREAGVLLVGLVLVCGALFGLLNMLEQVIFAGIGIYMALMGRGLVDPERPLALLHPLDRYRPLAPLLLRVFAGLTIIGLALTEKLLNPGLAQAFLREYPHFNVAQALGLAWFTDERFAYAAGIVELMVGVGLVAGVLPRLVIFAMFVPFNLAIPFLPPTELIGHLPIFSVMYVLMFHNPALRVDAPEGPTVEEVTQAEADHEDTTASEGLGVRG
jgi:uncharacterized membrane protein YphA (DoxX/SURF4 family)